MTFKGTYRTCTMCGKPFTSHGGRGQPWKYCPECKKDALAQKNAERVRRWREKHPPQKKPAPAKRREPGDAPVSFWSGSGAAPLPSVSEIQTAAILRPGSVARSGMFADLPVEIANEKRRMMGLPLFAVA